MLPPQLPPVISGFLKTRLDELGQKGNKKPALKRVLYIILAFLGYVIGGERGT